MASPQTPTGKRLWGETLRIKGPVWQEDILDIEAEAIAIGATQLREIEAELAERRASFNLRWQADMRAINMWQQAHPERGDLVWPDHADLVVWLMDALLAKP
jgi:hypothetical protein